MQDDGKDASKTRAKSNKWSLCGVALVLYSTLLDKTDIVLYYNISMINLPINKLLGFGKLIRNKWLYKAKISRWKFMGIEEFPSAPPHFKVLQMAVLSRL